MSFFENVTKKVGEAAQAAAKKSNELLEVTKTNMAIGSEEDKIKEILLQVGKKVYEKYSTTGEVSDDYKGFMEQIQAHENTILELKQKVLDLKNVKLCACGAEVDSNSAFCPKCGSKVG